MGRVAVASVMESCARAAAARRPLSLSAQDLLTLSQRRPNRHNRKLDAEPAASPRPRHKALALANHAQLAVHIAESAYALYSYPFSAHVLS